MLHKKHVWLSCDPGHDDALALILAGYDPAIELLGVDTVAANQTVSKVTNNALRILDAAGLARTEIHGESGLGLSSGTLPPTQSRALPGKAVLEMFRVFQESFSDSSEGVHLVCTGALTNVALLLTLFPEVTAVIEQIVVMGGAIGSGNTNPCAEFNMQVDPEAAKIVFESGARVVMVPLEVTHTALATPAVRDALFAGRATPFMALVDGILGFFAGTYRDVFGFDCPPVHDPCAVAYVVAPEIFETELMRVDIEVVSPLTAGQTVCDIYHRSQLPKNVHVAKRMDVAAFWQVLTRAVHAADDHSPLNPRAASSE